MEQSALSENTTNHSQLASFVGFVQQAAEGGYTISFHVKGMHCASCIQLIENALNAEDGVTAARVNMSTERLTVAWQGERERVDALAAVVIKLGYKLSPCDMGVQANAANDEQKWLLRCIAVAGFAAGNMMLISVGLWSTNSDTMGMATRDLFHWLSALIAFPTIFYSGRPFFLSAWSVLKERHTNMDVPISLAVILAAAMSLFETVNHGAHVYFDSAVMLLFFLLIGRYLDVRARGKARESAQQLLSMLSGTATVITSCGHQKTIPIRDVREGMTALVAVGMKIPSDGVVSEGESELDMSLITGETLPQHVKKGDKVFGGTINMSAPLQVSISKASEQSLLSDIVKLMEQAEQGQARYVRLADKAARLYTPLVHSLALLTFIGWLAMGQAWQVALLHAVTVLIITCPCALGLAVPVVQVLASGLLMKQGVLLKSGDALERLATITTVIFDKTGTLTLGALTLQKGDYSKQDMDYAASLASHSTHPLSRALSAAYDGKMMAVEKVKELPGKGLQGVIKDKKVKLGSRTWCGDAKHDEHSAPELWLSVEDQTPVCFSFNDQLREDAPEVVAELQKAAIDIMLLSGDRAPAVESIARQAGISDYRSSLSPVQKCDAIKTLGDEKRVLMVGDGLNDAPALAVAQVSMSPSSAIDITQNTADIVFQGQSLRPVYKAWQVACESSHLVRQNFLLAVLYNIIAIPLAVMGYVTPLIAAIAMSGSSLLVIGNSFRLMVGQKR